MARSERFGHYVTQCSIKLIRASQSKGDLAFTRPKARRGVAQIIRNLQFRGDLVEAYTLTQSVQYALPSQVFCGQWPLVLVPPAVTLLRFRGSWICP